MADFELIDKIEIVVSLAKAEDEDFRNFLIQYEILKIDQAAAVRAELEAAGEEYEEDDDDELEPDFIPTASIRIRELSEDDMAMMSDEPEEKAELGREVCTLSGWLIMSKLIEQYGYDPHMICDDFSRDLEYCWSALSDPSISAVCDTVENLNIFYVDAIGIAPEYDNAEERNGIIPTLLRGIIQIVNDALDDAADENVVNKRYSYEPDKDYYIDLIAFYPSPLPYDNSMQQKQTDIACGIVSQLRVNMAEKLRNPDAGAQDEPEITVKVAPELYLRAAGMRVSGDTYPAEAKNRVEWDLLEAAGWYECGNSRLLYMTFRDE